MTTETEAFLAEALPRWISADRAMHDGDAALRHELWSHRDPVTLFGAALSASAWPDVEVVFEHLEAEFSDCARFDIELVAAGASGDLGYTVAFEHTRVSVRGEPRDYTLRVTQVYRREKGAWTVVHRHADTPPSGDLAAAVSP